MLEKYKISSFDNFCKKEIFIKNIEKYNQLENEISNSNNLITMGSNYSYVAAGFKEKQLSININKFNRILFFNKEKKTITVEAGIKIFDLLNFTLQHQLWIPQIPGYPFITIGGAVAANIHGKSCGFHGTIRNSIESITIFNKNQGWLDLSCEKNKDIFDLTIGGLGLTGTIVIVTFNLSDFFGTDFITSITKTVSVYETIKILENSKKYNNLIYSWNEINSNAKSFGQGLVFDSKINITKNKIFNHLKVKERKKKIFFLNFWNKITIKFSNLSFFYYTKYLKKNKYIDQFEDVIFPFYGKEIYFELFGKKGFIESQVLISYLKINDFIDEFKKMVDIYKPDITIFSLKNISGEKKYLRFEDNKICLTFDMPNNKKNIIFLKEIYKLYIKYRALPSVIKDSFLDRETFEKCYEQADIFREDLRKFDPKRSYKSELSERLFI